MQCLERAHWRVLSLAALVGLFSATCQAQTSASGTMIMAPSAGVTAANLANTVANTARPISTTVAPAAGRALDVHPVSVTADTPAPQPTIAPSGAPLSTAAGANRAAPAAPMRRMILTQRTPMPIIPAYAAQHPLAEARMVSRPPIVAGPIVAGPAVAPLAVAQSAVAPSAAAQSVTAGQSRPSPLPGHLPEPVIDPSIGAGDVSAAANDTRIVIEPGAPAAPSPATLGAAGGGVARDTVHQLDTPVPPQFVAANTFQSASPPPALIPNLDQPGKQDNEAIRVAAEQFLRQQAAGLPGQVVITVKPAAPSGLTQCTALEPFLPPGARIWGRTTVGVRCVGEHPWTLYLQARVAVNGNYYVASRDIAPGQSISQADIEARQTDLTNMPRSVVTDLSQIVGTAAQSRITAGMPLRMDLLRTVNAVKFDQPVKLVAQGPGFSISSEGRALGNAAPGESVQVRTGSGQIISGVVKDGGTVEVPM